VPGGAYGESAGLAVTGGRDSSNRVGPKAADDVMGVGAWGRLPLCLGDVAVLGKAWRKATLSRNAGQIGLSLGQSDGHLVMRPGASVARGIWVAGHGGIFRRCASGRRSPGMAASG
jgi:hypothetical protein